MINIHSRPPRRRQNVESRDNYKQYKNELKQDFNNTCGYCGDDCCYFEPHIDHFRPQKPKGITQEEARQKFARLCNDYNNLVLACPFCNRRKSNKWPTGCIETAHDGQKGFIDPCDRDYDEQLKRHPDGRIYPTSPLGRYIFKELGLGVFRHQLLWLIENVARMRSFVLGSQLPDQEKIELAKKLNDNETTLKDLLREQA